VPGISKKFEKSHSPFSGGRWTTLKPMVILGKSACDMSAVFNTPT
jgi:hypothetical protein